MLTFDPAKWGDTELERWNGVVTAMRVKLHQQMGCGGGAKCPEECPSKHLCAWTRDVQIMCRKEMDRRHEGQEEIPPVGGGVHTAGDAAAGGAGAADGGGRI